MSERDDFIPKERKMGTQKEILVANIQILLQEETDQGRMKTIDSRLTNKPPCSGTICSSESLSTDRHLQLKSNVAPVHPLYKTAELNSFIASLGEKIDITTHDTAYQTHIFDASHPKSEKKLKLPRKKHDELIIGCITVSEADPTPDMENIVTLFVYPDQVSAKIISDVENKKIRMDDSYLDQYFGRENGNIVPWRVKIPPKSGRKT